MAALWFATRRMDLADALANIGELKNVIFNELQGMGFTDVVHNPAEVAGNRNGLRVSIVYLQTSGRNFWEVVMAGGSASVDDARQTVAQVVDKIEHLHFL
jgi:hypothetical protein